MRFLRLQPDQSKGLLRRGSRNRIRTQLGGSLSCAVILGLILVTPIQRATADGPRIVNIYNFVRNSDYRVPNSEEVLSDCTRHQIELLKSANLPATWALQYDALINPRYQKLFKERLGTDDEIGAWWEIPQPLAEKAGLKWRGQHEWDPQANVGFAPGYTPDERRKLVDVYMADFKEVFGDYPKTVGSWFIDEVTLEYMARKYGIVASCNCKDQVGTDGYTLWGGYWNQAYYPSRLDAYMPAQTRAGQIDVPIFRMLGSDPIYQRLFTRHVDIGTGLPRAGGSADWVCVVHGYFDSSTIAGFCLHPGGSGKFIWLERDENGFDDADQAPRQRIQSRKNQSRDAGPGRAMVSSIIIPSPHPHPWLP